MQVKFPSSIERRNQFQRLILFLTGYDNIKLYTTPTNYLQNLIVMSKQIAQIFPVDPFSYTVKLHRVNLLK